ncbi:MAG: hypothetical protein QM747_13945 [Nocardioides sp.]
MTATRIALGLAGLAAAAYGVLRLWQLGTDNLVDSATWLVGGVVLHDAVFAPVVIVVSLVAVRLAPPRLLAPVTVALVVLVPVTLLGVPELGRFGDDPRNATLLDRHYWAGWSVLVAVVLAAVAAGAWGSALRSKMSAGTHEMSEGGGDGAGDGGR